MNSGNKTILWQAHEAIVSGANIAMLEYIDALDSEFCSLVILPHKGNMEQELEQRFIPYEVIHQYGWTNVYPWWRIGKWIKVLLRSFAAVWQIKRLIKIERPALVCTNTLVPFTASIAARLQNIPHVWWIHEFGKEDFGFITGWGYEKISLWWMQKASNLIIGNSKAISAKFRKLMPEAVIETVYQPVSWGISEITAKPNLARFLMFGQLIASKGHKDVLQALISNKQRGKPIPTLHIKGPSEIQSYLNELQELVTQHELQQFVYIEAGYFKKEEVIPFYNILIVASHTEAFGRVIVEANKAGLRVLVRNCGGSPELVNETNGLLYENQSELSAILCGEINFPDKVMRLNYREDSEIRKLASLLNRICN